MHANVISEIEDKLTELDDNIQMMTLSDGNMLLVTGLLWGDSTSHRWISLTKACDAELFEKLVIWDATELIITSS